MRYRNRTYAILLTMLLAVALSLSGCGTGAASPTPAATFTPVVVTATRPPVPTDTSAPSPTETPVSVTDTPKPAPMNPTVAIAPSSGPPGTVVQVNARGFPPDVVVELGIGRPNSEYDVVDDATADSAGRVDTSMAIPAFVEPEDQWVIVVATQDHAVKAVSSVLEVTGQAAATATSGPSISRTQIYLIAVGDDGQSGKEIGCNDSVVPVEIEIAPTIAPLTAALERLLSIETREYGQSGLYNALHRSDLSVEAINIVDGEASIALSGTLTLGGVCDNPRVKAQLSETALQYATVDRVSITVNGTPLDDLLEQR